MSTMLRDSSETAARERLRLEARAGRSRPAAMLHRVPALAGRLGSEEAARSGLRYQPVAWTAIVLAAVAFYFPGRSDPVTPAPAAASSPVTVTVPASPPTTVPEPVVPTTAPLPVATFSPRPAAVAPPRATSAPTTTIAPAPVVPLAVRGFGWAASLSGSGLSTAEVPAGSMPVAARLGQLDKASFVRLAGTSPTLTLVEETGGAREAIGAGAVVLCPITDGTWREEPDQSLEAAPSWNADACVAGTEDGDTWVFDLSVFDDVAGDRGFALIPDANAPPDFQITFRAS